MDKEQTPITAEELYISIADVLGRHWEVDVKNTEKCVQIAEQYAQAKVLEALEWHNGFYALREYSPKELLELFLESKQK